MMNILDRLSKYENPVEKMARLKRKCDVLESREEDINIELNYAESLSLKKRKKSVENWLASVAEVKTRVHKLEQAVQQGGIFTHFNLLRTIDKLEMEVTELSHRVFSEGLTFEVHDNHGLELPSTELVGKKFHDRKRMIQESLSNADIFSIGICGMGGIGKTTLVTHIHNELLNHPNTSVFWVTMSQHLDIHKLQNDIAKALSVDLRNEDDEKKRAARIMHIFKRKNKVVLILDDLWNAFPPESVGIAIGCKCKLIFTTRSLEVCYQMACHLKIELEPLTNEEAWMLFTKTLGTSTTLTPQIEEIAKSLAKECAGLPLGIITTAGSMRGVDDIREWRIALEAMRSQSTEGRDNDHVQLEKVFQVLRHSYDALKDPTVKECFLYCSLFPKDWEIRRDDLIKYFIDEGLICGIRSRELEYSRGHHILSKLVKVCLLQGVSKGECVKMHNVVRDMALRTIKQKYQFRVEAGLMFVDVADEERWSVGLKRVSFMGSYLLDTLSSALPPRCPRLSTLLLRDCYNLISIPDSFFMHMNSLTILDLSRTGISKLPASVSHLKGLTALLLGSCHALEHVVPLSNLKALKRLDLSCTRIKELPQGMEMLSNLRDLNLHGAKCLQMIPEGVLSKLSHLQCLALPKLTVGRATAGEIASLQNLERFKGEFYNTNDLDTLLKSWKEGRPNKYKLLGIDVPWRDLDDINGLEKFVSIGNSHDLGTLCKLDSLRNASDLRTCYVGDSDRMTHLICRGCYSLPFVKGLENLYLDSLLNLCDLIWEDSCASSSSISLPSFPNSETFSSLKGFRICKCPRIKKLFTLALLSDLRNLETLKVYDCDKLLEIVQEQSDHDDQDREAIDFEQNGKEKEKEHGTLTGYNIIFSVLPKLKLLKLLGLPELKSFCRNGKMVSNSIKEIEIVDCPKLESVPFLGEELCPPTSIYSSNDCYASTLEGTSATTTESAILLSRPQEAGNFSSVNELTITRCHKIKKLLTLALSSCLEKLEKLVILDCKELEEIIQVSEDIDQDVNKPTSSTIMFSALPNLKVLKMEFLPLLKSFCRSRKIVSDSVEKISIVNCPKLQRFPLLREESHPTTSLKSITVDEEWWESTEFDHHDTKDVLRPICDFRRRFYSQVSDNC